MSDVLLFANPNNPSTNGLIAMMKSLRDVERIIWVKLHTTHFSSASDGTRNLMSAANAHSSREKFGKLSVDITLDLHIPNTVESERARYYVQQSLMRELVPALSFWTIENPIIWASDHRMADVCAALTQRNLIYYCAQEFPIASTTEQSIAFDQHRKLVEQADVVFASHEQLSPTLPKSKTFLLTQGVDLKLFCTPSTRATDLPDRARPIAGFYGDLTTELDYKLLLYTALNSPKWDFVIIGRNLLNYYPLPRLNNVHYLGPKHHHQMPHYSQHWQASLLPVKASCRTSASTESKILEYLAVGAPIISSDKHSSVRFQKYINFVESAHEMSEALNYAAYEKKSSADIVFSDSWQAKGRYVETILKTYCSGIA